MRDFLLAVMVAALLGCGQSDRQAVAPAESVRKIAPELDGGLTWLNSEPLKLADLRGKVVLLDFFEYSCINCIRTFPYLKEWQKRYGDHGLVIIGVHSPQYDFSMDPLNVYAGTHRLGLTHPILVDSDFNIANAYENRFSPRKFLVDKDGYIRFDHTGEGAYQETESMIQQLLHQIDPALVFPEPMAPVREIDKPGVTLQESTPELYLGQLRGKLGNGGNVPVKTPVELSLPEKLEEGHIYASGKWSNQSEYLRHTSDTETLSDFLLVRYRATEVNVVMKPESIYWLQVFVEQDGKWLPKDVAGEDIEYDEDGRSYVRVATPRMYNVVANQPFGSHEIRLYVMGKGLSVYSFSFGTCVMP